MKSYFSNALKSFVNIERDNVSKFILSFHTSDTIRKSASPV